MTQPDAESPESEPTLTSHGSLSQHGSAQDFAQNAQNETTAASQLKAAAWLLTYVASEHSPQSAGFTARLAASER